MMLSGLRWQKCESCPTKFLVLAESGRKRCHRCERARQAMRRRARQSKLWHERKQAWKATGR